ncbi:MAG: DNA recombination/repair protein RecA [Anaerolineae bacterium]|nr:DNA recombination/repair protein RecA [Anaerolineae bacterium]
MALSTLRSFDQLMTAIHRRWGNDAIVPLGALNPFSDAISTGFPPLDMALGAKGVPQHQLTTFIGSGTSGITSLAHTLVAQAQAQELIGVVIDPSRTFDPQSAQLRGVDLDLLLLVRPVDWMASLSILRDVLDIAVAGCAVLDAAVPDGLDKEALAALELTLNRISGLLPHSTWTVILLLPADLPYIPDHFAVLRLRCTCHKVIDSYPPGLQIEAHILKDKFRPAGARPVFDVLNENPSL